jgi:hypothetical protein
VALQLNIMVGGHVRYAVSYDPEEKAETASILNEHLPALRQFGRVAVFVRDSNVLHLIVTE